MHLNQRDWIGLGVSIGLHLLLAVGMAACNVTSDATDQIGFIEVDFGDFADGRPVQAAVEERPSEPTPDPLPEPEEEPQKPPQAPPEEAKPVDVPDQPEDLVDEEQIEDPQTEMVAPEPPQQEAEREAPEPEPEPEPLRPLGGAPPDGQTGADSGADGPGTDEQRAAPFDIEGLNRTPVTTELPSYREKVNATIRVRITVDPQGRVVRRIPLMKGNPALEQAVMDVLQRWRFNPLPANAPQESQTGIITFVFRLE